VRVRFSAMPFFLVTLAILIILLLNASFAWCRYIYDTHTDCFLCTYLLNRYIAIDGCF
jgi:hypothetical protein